MSSFFKTFPDCINDHPGIELARACASGHLNVVKAIISLGHLANYPPELPVYVIVNGLNLGINLDEEQILDSWYDFGLILASASGNVEIVKILIAAGANPAAVDSKAFVHACGEGQMEVVKFLSTIPAVNITHPNAIRFAGTYGKTKVVRFLLSNKSVKIPKNTIDNALAGGHVETAKILFEAGDRPSALSLSPELEADPEFLQAMIDAGLNVKTENKGALSSAALFGYPRTVKVLLDAGMDPTDGISPATAKGHLDIVEMLISSPLVLETDRRSIRAAINGGAVVATNVSEMALPQPLLTHIEAFKSKRPSNVLEGYGAAKAEGCAEMCALFDDFAGCKESPISSDEMLVDNCDAVGILRELGYHDLAKRFSDQV